MGVKLSIITINYNNQSGLAKTIASVEEQVFVDFEFFIVDGGSTDSSVDLIKRSKKINWWVSEKDKGVYDAQNKGIEKANGDYVLFLNSGDILANAQVLEKVFNQQLTADIIYGDLFFDFHGKKVHSPQPERIGYYHLMISSVFHPASFIRTALFHKHGTYDLSYSIAADYDFFVREIIYHKVTYMHVPIPIAVYDSTGMSSNSANKIKIGVERKMIQQKYFPLWARGILARGIYWFRRHVIPYFFKQ